MKILPFFLPAVAGILWTTAAAAGVRLTVPQYRNCFYPGQSADKVAGVVEMNGATTATAKLEGPGFPVRTTTVGRDGRFAFDTTGFQEGAATLTVTVGGRDESLTVRRLPSTGRQMVWIADGNLVVNGKKTLRRNVYAVGYSGGTKLKEAFEREKDKFHLTPELHRYVSVEPEVLVPGLEAREAKKDVKPCAAYFAKLDQLIEKNRDKDFGAYYLCDEPEMRKISPVYLKHIYDYLVEKDPYHPVFMATTVGQRFIDCIDWGETHPYLDVRLGFDGSRRYGHPPSVVGKYMDAFGATNRPDKVIGFLPTCFSYRYCGSTLWDYPTFRELVVHTWAGMIRGGKSLWAYAYHDLGDRPSLWLGLQYLYASFDALQDFFLDARRTTLVRTDAYEGVLYELGDEQMFALVNFTDQPQTVRIPALKGRFREFRGERTFSFSTSQTSHAAQTLSPFEVLVATTKPHDEGLETFAAADARIRAAEKVRTSRDNQLLERYESIICSANFTGVHGGRFFKLFDGMYGQVARSSVWGKQDLWLEMGFAGFRPRFDRLVIHGCGLVEKARFSVRSGGEWRTLAAKLTKRGKYLFTFDFGEPVSAVKLRMEFPCEPGKENKLELYEIEMPKLAESVAEEAVRPVAADPDTGVCWKTGPFSTEAHTNLRVTVDAEAEWYVLRPVSFRDNPVTKYRAWMVSTESRGYLCGITTHPQPGLYTIRVPKYGADVRTDRLQHYGYEMGVDYDFAALMKAPANRVEVETDPAKKDLSVGDTVKVRAYYASPVEEVMAETIFADMYIGTFNTVALAGGSTGIEMKPLDETRKVWGGEIVITSARDIKKRNLYFKVTSLGGGLDLPMYTNLPIPMVKERKGE